MDKKTAILLVNLGTPDSPSVKDVRSYLFQFLNDPRVIDIPWLARKLLVNLIIVPFRAPKSAKVYQQLWTGKGSPLLYYGNRVRDLLQEQLPGGMEVYLGMRYKNPSISQVLNEIRNKHYDRIIVLPLFPQYASATTGSVHEEVMRTLRTWWVIPEVKFISQFHNHPSYIASIVERARKYTLSDYDHILFSYHGLPDRHVEKVHLKGQCPGQNCEEHFTEESKYCYKATCFETSRLIAKALNISKEKYTVCFQSRLDKGWLRPFSDEVVIECGKKGMKKILVFSPAFVADCLETIIEIGEEYQHLFVEHGGEKVQLVESLNDHPDWIQGLKSIVLENT